MLDLHIRWPKLFSLPSKRRGFYATDGKPWYAFHNYGKLSEWKGWEVQIDHWGWSHILDIEISFSLVGEDHAGLHLGFGLFGYTIYFDINDSRHWDYENNCWEKYDEESYKFREDKWEEEKRLRIENAYQDVAQDIRRKDREAAEAERLAWEATPEGQTELKRIAEEEVRRIEAEKAARKAAKKARGEEYKRRNQEASGDTAAE